MLLKLLQINNPKNSKAEHQDVLLENVYVFGVLDALQLRTLLGVVNLNKASMMSLLKSVSSVQIFNP